MLIAIALVVLTLGAFGLWMVWEPWDESEREKWLEYHDADGGLYRKNDRGDVEKFEPDCGGNTAGHWDKFNKPTFNHNHYE